MKETSVWQINLYSDKTPSKRRSTIWVEADSLEELIEVLKNSKKEIGEYNESVKDIIRITPSCLKPITKTIVVEL